MGCVATVTPFLDALKDVHTWNVDTKTPARILTVTGEKLSVNEVIETVREAGFEITQVAG